MAGDAGKLTRGLRGILSRNLGELAGVQGSLLSAAESRKIRSILVTSCQPREGKTITSVGMAYALSLEANASVLLVDGNFTAPNIHNVFNVRIEPGFSDLLTSTATYEEVVRSTEDKRLTLIPHGASTTSFFDVYHSASFEGKLASLQQNRDYLIVDGHSVFGSSDASMIGKCFDGIVLVVECEKTRWEVVQMAKERLNRAGGNILGVVLNKRKYYIPQALYGGG